MATEGQAPQSLALLKIKNTEMKGKVIFETPRKSITSAATFFQKNKKQVERPFIAHKKVYFFVIFYHEWLFEGGDMD